ncbi:MAG: OsmC family protein [Ferruginibacter sp.]
MKQHHYNTRITWTGNTGKGTESYKGYERNHTISIEGKQEIAASSDPAFSGDAAKHNPEDLLLASLSSCHMLWYLHLCADNGIVVTAYSDHAEGTMTEDAAGGRFTEVILHPVVTVSDETKKDRANELHNDAHQKCFIANSCNFLIQHEPVCKTS